MFCIVQTVEMKWNKFESINLKNILKVLWVLTIYVFMEVCSL